MDGLASTIGLKVHRSNRLSYMRSVPWLHLFLQATFATHPPLKEH